jgi:hypothetical protein
VPARPHLGLAQAGTWPSMANRAQARAPHVPPVDMQVIEVRVPVGTDAAVVERYAQELVRSNVARDRVATALEKDPVGPGVSAQLAAVEQLWRHLSEDYGVYRAGDIARLRGASATNRSLASRLAKQEGLLSFTRGGAKVYPQFQFKGSNVHPDWRAVVGPLAEAGWDSEDTLLWMVSPHPLLGMREPAQVLVEDSDVGELVALTQREALGTW